MNSVSDKRRVSLSTFPKDAKVESLPGLGSNQSATIAVRKVDHLNPTVPLPLSDSSPIFPSPRTAIDEQFHLVSSATPSDNSYLNQSDVTVLKPEATSNTLPADSRYFEKCSKETTILTPPANETPNKFCDNLKDHSEIDVQSSDTPSNLSNRNTSKEIEYINNNKFFIETISMKAEETTPPIDATSATMASTSSFNDADTKSLEYDDKRLSMFTDVTCSQSDGFKSESLSPATHDNEHSQASGLQQQPINSSDEPPFIEDLQPETISVIRGKTVELVATFVGHPLPEAGWFKGNKQLLASEFV